MNRWLPLPTTSNMSAVLALVFLASGAASARQAVRDATPSRPTQTSAAAAGSLTGHGSTLTGSVVTDDRTPPPFAAAGVQIMPIAADGADDAFNRGGLPAPEAPRAQTVRPDWSFAFSNIDGRYLFRVMGLPNDWMLQSVKIGDRDITDTPLDITAGAAGPAGGRDTTGVQLVITSKTARLSGDVIDAHGAPLPDSTVLVFAADPSRWGVGTRFVKSVRPDHDAHFIVEGLPGGAYLVIAKEYVADRQWANPALLQSLVPAAARLDLHEGTTQTVSLKVEDP